MVLLMRRNEEKCLLSTLDNAPFNAWLMSRSTRPVTSAYLNTCPLVCNGSLWRFCFRYAITLPRALMSVIGRLPSHGNKSRSNRDKVRFWWLSDLLVKCLAYHSNAIALKLFSVAPVFFIFRSKLGSMPSTNCFFAASRLSLAIPPVPTLFPYPQNDI